jgi:hypothetical protein
MWSLPDINSMNARAASNAKKIQREANLKTSRKFPCECCGKPSSVHEKWFDIFSDDAKAVRHLCQSCAEDGRGDEGFFTCDSCNRLIVENYTWERYEQNGICLACAAENYFSNNDNLIDPKQVKSVVLQRDGELFEDGVLNLAKAPHVLGVKQPIPAGVEFVENFEFDSTSGRQISGGDMLFDIQQMDKPFFVVCDAAYQFAVSIGLYVRENPTAQLKLAA